MTPEKLAEQDEHAAKILRLARHEVGSPDATYAVVETLLGLFQEWSSEGPVLRAMDDLQWVDPTSAMFAYRLGPVSRQEPLLLAVACRTGQLDTHIERLLCGWQRQRAPATQTELRPPASSAVDQLLAAETLAEPGPQERAWAAGAAGNPYYHPQLIAAR
ncbi:hypothetical protein [Streptacidiphilus fuscans]|uniref:Uncharacterized protein n=1 Tax=Streptacidiphilus fuscans TaxID=2789292 RepID=A0A931BAY1_9ACTN|nr:hypothetical protein [Streptacidiphilus fuscans]MBF9072832.1 hypothetical protein [Streptacidiphilus fuscans]